MFCMNCGQQLPDGAKFCMNCGLPVGAVSPTGDNQSNTAVSGIHNYQVGDEISFGILNGQSNTWKILRLQERLALVICSTYICEMPFQQTSVNNPNDISFYKFRINTTWGDCTLRKWLNQDFIYGYFSQSERERILPYEVNNVGCGPTTDKVFLLNIREVLTLLPDEQSRAIGTHWWLREPGYPSTNSILHNIADFDSAGVDKSKPEYSIYAGVFDSGAVDACGYIAHGKSAVRPAMWIRLDP